LQSLSSTISRTFQAVSEYAQFSGLQALRQQRAWVQRALTLVFLQDFSKLKLFI
jgi:hypothetical protein